MDRRPVDRGLCPHAVWALGPRIDPRLASRRAQLCLPRARFSISVGAVASVGLLLAPLADIAALRGHPHWLALYPALFAAGLAGTGFGVILSMGLFLAAGPRRARLFCQIAATAVGASAVIGAQVVAMLPEGMRTTVLAVFAPRANAAGAAQGLLWAPVRAAAGDPRAILVWTAFGAIVFALACLLFGERFARAAIASSGAPAQAGVAAKGTARFGASASAALRIKERRVVWRDPWLMSQLLLQAAYTTPLAVILWRGGGPTGTVGVAFTPALVVIAAQLAGALSWIALSAEDAPDFLTTAPLPRAAIERAKIAAIGQPIALILALPLAALGLRFALGRVLRASVRRRSDRLGGAGQSLATGPVPSRPRAPTPFPVEARRHDGASGLDPVGGGDGRRRHRILGDRGSPCGDRGRARAQPQVGGRAGRAREANVTRFGFSWPPALSLPNAPQAGLDFLGFPWILSSETRLINGLRAIFAKNISRASPGLDGRCRASLKAELIAKPSVFGLSIGLIAYEKFHFGAA